MKEQKISFKKIIKNTFFTGLIGIASIFVISWVYQGASLSATLNAVRPIYLFIAICSIILNWLVEALRIQKIADALGKKMKFVRILEITLMAGFVSKITPFHSGGEPFQIYFFHKDRNMSLGTSTSIIMIKTLFSHLARLSMGLLIPVFIILFKIAWNIPRGLNIALNIGLTCYIIFVFLLILIFFKPHKVKHIISFFASMPILRNLHPEKIDNFVTKVHNIIDDFKEVNARILKAKTKDLILVGTYSLLCWIFIFLVPVFLLRGMGIGSPIVHILIIVIFFQLASAYAPTPGSSGIAEIGFASLFSVLVPHSLLFILVILWRIITYYLGFLVGAILTLKEAIISKRKKTT